MQTIYEGQCKTSLRTYCSYSDTLGAGCKMGRGETCGCGKYASFDFVVGSRPDDHLRRIGDLRLQALTSYTIFKDYQIAKRLVKVQLPVSKGLRADAALFLNSCL